MRTPHVAIGITAVVGVGLGLALSRLPFHLDASVLHHSAARGRGPTGDADVRAAPHLTRTAKTGNHAIPAVRAAGAAVKPPRKASAATDARPGDRDARGARLATRLGLLVVAPGSVKLSAPSIKAVPLPEPPSADAERERLVTFPAPTLRAAPSFVRPPRLVTSSPRPAMVMDQARDGPARLDPPPRLSGRLAHYVTAPASPQPRTAPRAAPRALDSATTTISSATHGATATTSPRRASLAPFPSHIGTATAEATTAPSLDPTTTSTLTSKTTATSAPSPSATPAALTATATAVVDVTPPLATTQASTPTPPLTTSSTSAATVLTGTAAVAALQKDPAAAAERARVIALTTKPLQRAYISYVVQPGDSVESIAKRFHDVAWLIRRRNGGLPSMAPGQTILVWRWPFGTPSYALVPADLPQTYAVKSGDTLEAIATALHTDAATLVSQNGLSGGGSFLSVGQALILHHYSATAKQRVFVPGVSADKVPTGLLLTDISNLVGTDAALVKGLVWHETGWTMVRGASGEIGMVQIMPYMSSWVEKALVGYRLDPYARGDNILEGTLLLQYYLDATGGDVHKSLALYHSGNMRADARNGAYLRAILALRGYYYHNSIAGF